MKNKTASIITALCGAVIYLCDDTNENEPLLHAAACGLATVCLSKLSYDAAKKTIKTVSPYLKRTAELIKNNYE